MYNNFISKTDSKGRIYSIDKCTLKFDGDLMLVNSYLKFHGDEIIEYPSNRSSFKFLRTYKIKNKDSDSSIFVGLYFNRLVEKEVQEIETDEDDNISITWKKKKVVEPCENCIVDFNPNKLSDNDIKSLKSVLAYGSDITLSKIDFAIDINEPRMLFYLPHTDKQKYTYVGSNESKTEYLGVRGNNGYTKLYDKQLEQKLDYPLTRLEITLKDSFNFDVFNNRLGYYSFDDAKTPTDKYILMSACLLNPNDREAALSLLDQRKKRALFGVGSSSACVQFSSDTFANVFISFIKYISKYLGCQFNVNFSYFKVDSGIYCSVD